mgnify:CR=1 FL=1
MNEYVFYHCSSSHSYSSSDTTMVCWQYVLMSVDGIDIFTLLVGEHGTVGFIYLDNEGTIDPRSDLSAPHASYLLL